jgi:tetrahydrodipicolinate N-succinyltransferase
MVSAGTVFTNDRFPRAALPDLSKLRPSEPDQRTRPTLVREGATIGARCVIGCDLTIGRWSMVGMGSVVTRSVPDFHLVIGHPARPVGFVCRCGEPFLRFDHTALPDCEATDCPGCGLSYAVESGQVIELTPPLALGTAGT